MLVITFVQIVISIFRSNFIAHIKLFHRFLNKTMCNQGRIKLRLKNMSLKFIFESISKYTDSLISLILFLHL